MSMFGIGHQGLTLRALLQNPDLQNPPDLSKVDGNALKKNGQSTGHLPHNSAFLGPNLWEKPSTDGTSDFDLEYMDLDEFLSENGIPVNPEETGFADPNAISLLADALTSNNTDSGVGSAPSPPSVQIPSSVSSPFQSPQRIKSPIPKSPVGYLPESPQLALPYSPARTPPSVESSNVYPEMMVAREMLGSPIRSTGGSPRPCSPTESTDIQLVDIPGQDGFDPQKRKFSEEELKPQPMIKKSRKVFVAEDNKDEKYWTRRKKNNVAAKRSRDARRVKENQIAMRAAFLETENDAIKKELQKMRLENQSLQKRLAKYEAV